MRFHGWVILCIVALLSAGAAWAAAPAIDDNVTQGALRATKGDTLVECPLKHTDVKGAISGFLANVTVTQTFTNPYDEKIEAVYVFPLPHTAAVTAMTMVVGDRTIVGLIKRRAEARDIYEQALEAGQTASLLEQERPNIFTQSVGNIPPKGDVKIVITYTDVLKYDMGTYEFHFPMVVGPRYNPGAPFAGTPGKAHGAATATATAPTGVNPAVTLPGLRTGHDISLALSLNAGVPVYGLVIPNHQATVTHKSDTKATIILDPADNIPNKDFVLRYTVIGDKPALAVLAHNDGSDTGYFMLMIQPKIDDELAKAPPRELVFLVDVSGSMNGAPTEKNKALLREFFHRMKPNDTFQMITFASQAQKVFDKAVPATDENGDKALAFIDTMQAGGGTEMMKGIDMVLDEPLDPQRARIVVMLTDGFIGNEAQIIEAVGKKAGDAIKFWTLGIGSAPNRFLLDGIAKQGGGASAVVELTTDPAPVAESVMARIHHAQLAHLAVNWNGLPVQEIYPRRIPELWAGRPVILYGRYTDGGATRIEISGDAEGQPVSFGVDVVLPANADPANAVLAPVWARRKIEDLSEQMYYGDDPAVIEEITQTALTYKLMSQYTSFVAVDAGDPDVMASVTHRPRRVDVSVPLPEGVSFEGIFGSPSADSLEMSTDISGVPLSVFSNNGGGTTPSFRLGVPPTPTPAGPTGPAGAAGPTSTSTGLRIGSLRSLTRLAAFLAKPTTATSPSYTTTAYSAPWAKTGAVGGLAGYSPAAPSMHATKRSIDGKKAAPLASMKIPASPHGGIVAGYRATKGDAVLDSRARGARREVDKAIAADDEAAAPTFFDAATEKCHTEAAAALAQVATIKDPQAAFLRAQQAYLLAAMANRAGAGDEELVLAAQSVLQDCGEKVTKLAVAKLPALKTKLDLTIRNRRLPDALASIAKASGLALRLQPGALADVTAFLNGVEPRAEFLDLRGATTAEALDCLLTPAHLSWRVDKAGVLIGVTRRMSGDSVWTYQVGDLAQPISSKDPIAELVKFQTVARQLLGQTKDTLLTPGTVALLDPAHLVVYGDPKFHGQVAALLDALAAGKPDVAAAAPPALKTATLRKAHALQAQTAVRWAKRKEARAARTTLQVQAQIRAALGLQSWALLASAAKGELNLEALTALQAAWASPQLTALLGDSQVSVPRAAWAIAEAATRLPKETELQALNIAARKTLLAALPDQLKATGDPGWFSLALLYETQALPLDDDLQAQITPRLTGLPADNAVGTVARALLAPSPEHDTALTAALQGGSIRGDDLTALAGLTAQHRGGTLWQAWYERLPDLTGKQRLNGNVVLYANRLKMRN